MYVNVLHSYYQYSQTTWAQRNNNPTLCMTFESHEAVRWNRALWIYFAWIEMADVWPAELFLFSFFLPFPLSLLLGFPWELLCLWTAPQLPAASLKLPQKTADRPTLFSLPCSTFTLGGKRPFSVLHSECNAHIQLSPSALSPASIPLLTLLSCQSCHITVTLLLLIQLFPPLW